MRADDQTNPRTPWIEVECPTCGLDEDLEPQDADARWRCSGCGSIHRVGDIGQLCIPGAPDDGRDDKWFQTWETPADG